jgi:hypothetical protein
MLLNPKFNTLPLEQQEKFLKWLEAVMGPKAVEQFKQKNLIQSK